MVPFLKELVRVETTIQKWPNVGWFTLWYQTHTKIVDILWLCIGTVSMKKHALWIQKLEASNQNLIGFLWIEMDSIEYLEIPI